MPKQANLSVRRIGRAAIALATAALFGCASNPPASTPAAPPANATASATSARPAPAPITWSVSPTRSRKRNHQLTWIATTPSGSFLYAAGGMEGMGRDGFIAAVDAAPIAKDGSVGAFRTMPTLPKGLMGPAGAITSDGVVVVAGGQSADGFEDATYTSVVQANGDLSPWKAMPALPRARMHAAGFAIGSRVYVVGGFSRKHRGDPCTLWDDVLMADVKPNGTIAAWTSAGTMPAPRSHMSASEADGYVYFTGGLLGDPFTDPPSLTDVTRARVANDGTLAQWTPMTKLPVGTSTHASFVHDGWLYVVGGIDDVPTMRAQVFRAKLVDHALGAWEAAGTLPRGRGHVHQVPILGDHAYSVGGAIDFDLHSTDEIAVGTFTR